MVNCFEQMIQDVFKVPQFIDTFEIVNDSSSSSSDSSSSLSSAITCVKYAQQDDAILTQFGMDQGIDFILTCKVKDFTPQKNMKIKFHDKIYKIVSWHIDSFQLTYNLNLKSLTSK